MEKITKPPVGAACNGCGVCCKAQICGQGALIMKLVENPKIRLPGPCPALIRAGGLYQCGLLISPKKYIKSVYSEAVLSAAVYVLIGGGYGCDDPGDNPTEEDLAMLEKMKERLRNSPGFFAIVDAAAHILYGNKM